MSYPLEEERAGEGCRLDCVSSQIPLAQIERVTARNRRQMAQTSQKSDISRFGHVLLGIERAFIAHGYQDLSTTVLMQWTHCGAMYRGKTGRKQRQNHCRAIHRAAARLADRVGRARSRGSPWLWRLREIGPIG
jgi:hypothetical protein